MNEQSSTSLILQQFLPYRIGILAKRISDSCASIYSEEFGITIPEWRILARLAEQPGLNAKDIGEYAFMDKSKVSRAVKALDDKGYLIKERDTDDNRVSYLALSEAGHQLYHELAPRVLEWEAQLLVALDAPEYRDLFRIMEKLGMRLDAMEKEA